MKFTLAAASLLAVAPAVLAAPSGGSMVGGPGSILNFVGRVNIAVNQVHKSYSKAILYECNGRPDKDGQKVTDPETQISRIDCVFALNDGTQGSATISSTGWGEFGPVQTNPSPWLEDLKIDLQKDVKVNLGDAYKTCVKAGKCPHGITVVTLRKPLYPFTDEPYYIFNTGGNQYVFVGTKTGKIHEDKN